MSTRAPALSALPIGNAPGFKEAPHCGQIVASGGTATPHSAHFFTTITRYDNFWRQAAQALKKGAVQNDLELGNLDDARG
jgi:hypothetical protein